MAKLTKKERELMDWYKVKYRFDTAKTEEDYMNAVKQANDYLTTGTTGLEEKQLFPCKLINADNADDLENFVYSGN